ncbi:MAG TPA: hypothetical protein VGW33_13685 [Terriglobia bacterium]|nr:hypothetical protein [Terriglobia bacterium]
MSLRKSPTMTPARLAANRANAAQSTGPRTAAGKNRVRWNAIKKGLHAGSFREWLVSSGENPLWFDFFRDRFAYPPEDKKDLELMEGIAIDYWWAFIGSCTEEEKEVFRKTNPESLFESVRVSPTLVLSRQRTENKRLMRGLGLESRQRIENKAG